MALQIPNQFKLFSQQWTIRPAHTLEIGDDLGQARPDQLEILLNANQNWESILHTCLHEVLHAVETKMALEMTERQIDCMALGLIDFIRNNPKFIDIYKPQEETQEENGG